MSAPSSDVPSAPCDVCRGESERWLLRDGWWIRECRSCGHRFTESKPDAEHVDRHYGDDYFFGGGAGYSDYPSEERLIRAHGRRYARILARHMPPGRVLDVGAAAGFLLQGLGDAGWSGVGLEPNARMAALGRERFGLDLRTGSLESFVADEQFDLVSMVQVVGHFHDLHGAFDAAARLVRPGGWWLIESWNRRSWTARLFGKNWHEYSPPTVLRWFAPEDLVALGRQRGFEPVARGRPTKWLDAGHARSLLRHKLEGSLAGRCLLAPTALIPSRLPIPYPSEDLFWMLLRKTE